MRNALTAAALLATTTLLSANLVACTTNPVTGRKQFNYLSTAEEVRIGQQAAPDLINSYGGAANDTIAQNYVKNLGADLATRTEGDYPDLPWTFTLLNSDVVNAFALPGGQVFITKGLAKRLTTEAQLAGVLGHEIGHVTGQHADDAMVRQFGLNAVTLLAQLAADASDSELTAQAAGLFVTGAGIFSLRYDRNQELEADRLGIRYMTRAGYDPRGLRDVMMVFESLGSGDTPEWLSTHPAPSSRISQIDALIDELGPNAQGLREGREAYRTNLLTRIALLEDALQSNTPLVMPANFLDNPGTWCAHCAQSH